MEKSVLAAPQTPVQTISGEAGRSRVSVAISLAMIAIAATVLYHLLHGIDFSKVMTTLTEQSPLRIAFAGALVVAGYANLICYDLFALRMIGKHKVPLRVAAFASFTSYTIGHSLGVATLTCGLVRFRVYSFWGLTAVDIAKIAFMTGITFWLGNLFVLGGAVAYVPAALSVVDQLPPWVNRAAGFAALLAIISYLLWLTRKLRPIGRANWQIVLPSPRLTLMQIGIGTSDRLLASLSLFILLPATPYVGFATVVVVFVFATLLGAVSHTPGSLGVVEAVILIGLPQYPREELFAIVLTFRVLDFFLPLALAATMFGLRELRLMMRRGPASKQSGTNLVRHTAAS